MSSTRTRRRRLGVACVALALAATAATSASAEMYSLKECTVRAMQNALGPEQARANLQSAEADVTGARSGFLPRVDVGGSWTKPEETAEIRGGMLVSFDDSFWSANGSVSLELFDGLGTYNRWKAAHHGKDAAEGSYDRALQDVVLETETRYVGVLEKKALFDVAKEAVEVSAEQLKKTEAMRELGAATLADVYKAQVDHQNNLLTELGAERDLRVARASLATWMGLDPRTAIEIAEDEPWDDVPYSLEEAVERARERSPDLQASESQVSSNRHSVRAARAELLPSLSMFASGNFLNTEFGGWDDETTEWRYGLRLNWTLFDGFLTKANIRRAQSNVLRSTRAREDTERVVLFNVSQAWYDLEVARRAVEVAEVAVKSSEEDLRLAQERFRVGEGTILDVIDAGANLTRARSDLITSSYSARLVAARLRSSIGELTVPEEGLPE